MQKQGAIGDSSSIQLRLAAFEEGLSVTNIKREL